MTYVVESTRNNIAAGIDALAEVVSRPQFRDWELRDSRQQLELDIEVFKATPEIRIVERLHKMAFKNALSNSLYAPKFNLGNLDNYQHVENFRDKHFNQNNMILVGLGIDESDLVRYSNDFIFASKGDKAAREPAKYAGGEYRKQNASELVQVALAFEGASLTSKDLVASGLLCHAFGTGPRVLHTAGSNRISKACLPGATHGPAMIAAFNMNYSDSGLFGFHVLANKGDAQNVVRSVFKDLAKAGSNGITNAELESAKNSLKFSLAEHLENPINQINTFAASPEHANEYANINSIAKAIDGVTVDCVNAFAKRVSAGKPTLVAVGNLSQFARLDDIRA
jgi:ubiquinol-cytochrome c reductase core subunit 2